MTSLPSKNTELNDAPECVIFQNDFQRKMKELYINDNKAPIPLKIDEKDKDKDKDQYNDTVKDSLTITQIRKYIDQKDEIKNLEHKFSYDDGFSIAQEIDEFYSYTELTRHIDNQKTFNEVVDDWSSISLIERKSILHVWLESLEHADRNRRFRASQCLLYFAQGEFSECEKPSEQLEKLIQNNRLLNELGALQFYYDAIKMTCVIHDDLAKLFIAGGNVDSAKMSEVNLEIGILLSLLYLLVEVNRPHSKSTSFEVNTFSEDIASLEPPICPFLFGLISKLKEKSFKGYPIKKVLLILWKTLITIYGNIDTCDELVNFQRAKFNLPPKPNIDKPKVEPEEFNLFYYNLSLKFPSCYAELGNRYYTTPPTGIKWAFHSPRPSHLNYLDAKGFSSMNNDDMNGIGGFYPISLPLTKEHPILPKPIEEASRLFNDHLYFPLHFIQLLETSTKLYNLQLDPEAKFPPNFISTISKKNVPFKSDNSKINYSDDLSHINSASLKFNSKTSTSSLNENIEILEECSSYNQKRLNRIEELYYDLIPESHSIVVVLLKLLLATIPAPRSSNENFSTSRTGSSMTGLQMSQSSFGTKEGELVPPFDTPIHLSTDEIDDIRHKEIVSKAVSSIILFLLKVFKASHILKSEYYSQLLTDSNAILLILKLYGLQDFSVLAKIRNECDHLCFFKALLRPSLGTSRKEKGSQLLSSDTSFSLNLPFPLGRSIYTAINFFRILHQLTKGKLARIMMMVQFKSSAILKRGLKVGHPKLNHYILKLLKSQIPFLGRKWKQNNMKIITSIFLNSRQGLLEDWVLPYDVEQSLEQQSTSLKELINGYHNLEYPNVDFYKVQFSQTELGNSNRSKSSANLAPKMPPRSFSTNDNIPSAQQNNNFKSIYHSKSVNSIKDSNLTLSQDKIGFFTNTNYKGHLLTNERQFNQSNDVLKLANLAAHSGFSSESDLDEDFKFNYEEWLESEVFNKSEDLTILEQNDKKEYSFLFNSNSFLQNPFSFSKVTELNKGNNFSFGLGNSYNSDGDDDDDIDDKNESNDPKQKPPLSPPLF